VRSAVVSDLKTAAASKVLKRVPRLLRRRRRRLPQRRDGGSEGTSAGPEARAASRRALRKRAVRGARRRPDLAVRFAGVPKTVFFLLRPHDSSSRHLLVSYTQSWRGRVLARGERCRTGPRVACEHQHLRRLLGEHTYGTTHGQRVASLCSFSLFTPVHFQENISSSSSEPTKQQRFSGTRGPGQYAPCPALLLCKAAAHRSICSSHKLSRGK